MYVFKSPGTRATERLLRKIDPTSLKNFLNIKFKNIKADSINSITLIFTAIPSNQDQSSVNGFVDALNDTNNMERFLNAIEKQAKSLGTKKSGLFYKLIYQNIQQKINNDADWNKNVGTLKQFEKELRKFLLAKKGQDIEEAEAPKDLEQLTDEEKQDPDKKCKKDTGYRRKHNSNVIEKLKSGRLSNVLKVFMVLVLWKYVTDKIKELNSSAQPQSVTAAATTKTTPQSNPEPEPESSAHWDTQDILPTEMSHLISKIQQIYSFVPEGIELSKTDQMHLMIFRSAFGGCCTRGVLDIEKLRNELRAGSMNINEIENNIKKLWPLVNKISVPKVKEYDIEYLSQVSEKGLVQDLRNHFEKGDQNLIGKQKSFREIVNHAQRRDGDIDLSFQESFFEQTFDVAYREQDEDEICRRWGVSNTIAAGEYHTGCPLEKKLTNILENWFPNCMAEDSGGEEVPITRYIFERERFSELINNRKEFFSPKLFVKILYSFEEEAKRLKLSPEDFNNGGMKAKNMTPEQEKLRTFWSGAKTALISMASGCCAQVQKAINKIAEYYDVYQTSKYSTVDDSSSAWFDRKFCQMLREEATNIAVGSCRKAQGAGISAPEYAFFIKSIFTQLVNVASSGYHTEEQYSSLGETYQSLAIKWKDAISSFELIKHVFGEICFSMSNIVGWIDQLKKEEMSFFDFVFVVKSIDKSDRSSWQKDMNEFYSTLREELNGEELEQDAINRLQRMKDWIDNKGKFTLFELQAIVLDDCFGLDEKLSSFKVYKLIHDEDASRTLAYILHLKNEHLISING